jgi:hypothetical protein
LSAKLSVAILAVVHPEKKGRWPSQPILPPSA